MKQLMTSREAADHLRTSEGALAQWRYRGVGPAYVKFGKRVMYRHEDLDAWVAGNLVRPEES